MQSASCVGVSRSHLGSRMHRAIWLQVDEDEVVLLQQKWCIALLAHGIGNAIPKIQFCSIAAFAAVTEGFSADSFMFLAQVNHLDGCCDQEQIRTSRVSLSRRDSTSCCSRDGLVEAERPCLFWRMPRVGGVSIAISWEIRTCCNPRTLRRRAHQGGPARRSRSGVLRTPQMDRMSCPRSSRRLAKGWRMQWEAVGC
jgi:hypothetical protein